MMSSGGGAMQEAVANEVNKRLAKATSDLEVSMLYECAMWLYSNIFLTTLSIEKAKYATGNASTDESVDGPTGQAYKEKAMKEKQQMKKAKDAKEASGMWSYYLDVLIFVPKNINIFNLLTCSNWGQTTRKRE